MDTSLKQKRFRFSEKEYSMIRELAEEKNISENQVMVNALELYYSDNVVPEHIILGRITQLEQKLGFMDKKIETFSSLMYYILPFIFAGLPDLPNDRSQSQLIIDKSAYRFKLMVQGFKNYQRKENISFVQSIWGDLQETLEETYKENK